MKYIACCFLFLFSLALDPVAQELHVLDKGMKTSLRGLSVVDNNTIWASGSNGKIARSTDGGKSFVWCSPKGHESRDFRDTHAFDSMTAIIMAVAEPAIILKTKDGGKNWYTVFFDSTKGMFLDALDMKGDEGVVIGDPLVDKPFMATTRDKGETWKVVQDLPASYVLEKGEAFFAASGSNICLLKSSEPQGMIFASGGVASRLFIGDRSYPIPIQQGKSTAGANGILLFKKQKEGVIVGGDFSNEKRADSTISFFSYKGKVKFTIPPQMPHGYKSGAAATSDGQVLVCGTSGVELTSDKGRSWKKISPLSFHVAAASPDGTMIYLAGAEGKIARVVF